MDILTINDRPGEYPKSYYAATATPLGPYPAAEGALVADVVIVGAGYTGLSAALALSRAGLSVIVLEASRVGAGASGRNGGQVGTGQRVDQDTLEAQFGPDRAKVLWGYGLEAVDLVKSLVAEGQIDCDFTPGILHANHRRRYDAPSRAYVDLLQDRYGYDKIRYLDRTAIRDAVGSDSYWSGSMDMGGGHLHPLRYVFGLARMAEAAGARIFETSRVTQIDTTGKPRVVTERATVVASHLIVAMNGYHNNLVPQVARKVMPINNFIVATEPLPDHIAKTLIPSRAAVADSRFVVNYFRLTRDNRMLFGGGESYGYRFPADLAERARKPMTQIYPQLRDVAISHAWGGTLGITMSRLPHFTRLGPASLSCAGYSGHGVAMATWAGKMAAEAVLGQAARFDTIAALPSAPFPGGPGLRTPLLIAAMTWYSLRDRL